MEVSLDLVPESDLPRVPARDPCGEQSLHVAQEHHPVYSVVLTTGLLPDTNKEGSHYCDNVRKGSDNFDSFTSVSTGKRQKI